MLSYKNKRIIYQKNARFKITPDLDIIHINKLHMYINELKLYYVGEVGSAHLFFWKFNSNTHSIVIDPTTSDVSIDFRDQLVKIANWLFNYGFNLDGSFCFRKLDSIEYITIAKSDTMIKHYVWVEKIDMEYIDDVSTEIKLMIEAEEKIQSRMQKKYKVAKKTSKSYHDRFSYFIGIVAYTSLVAFCSVCIYKTFLSSIY